MGDDSAGHGVPGIDKEIPGGAVKAIRRGLKKGLRHGFIGTSVPISAKVPVTPYDGAFLYGKVLRYRAGY
jgi:hypothetical protein